MKLQTAPTEIPQKKKKNKIWLWIIAVLLIAVVGYLFFGDSKMNSNYQEATATLKDLTSYYTFSGKLTPVNDDTQTAKESMKIMQWYVEEGDEVKVGDMLFRSTEGLRVDAAYAGVIETIYPTVDDTVQPGSNLVHIVDYNTLEVSIDVDEYDIKVMELGKQGEVYINALEETVIGTVSDIARNATDEGDVNFYPVTMQVDGLGKVRSGMSVEVKVINKKADGVVALPVDTISYDEENKPYVLVLAGKGEYSMQTVTTGVSDGKFVEIISGITEDDTVYFQPKDTMRFFPQPGMMPGQMGKGRK